MRLQVKKVMLIGEESEEGRVKLPIVDGSSADYGKCTEAPRSRSQCDGCCLYLWWLAGWLQLKEKILVEKGRSLRRGG